MTTIGSTRPTPVPHAGPSAGPTTPGTQTGPQAAPGPRSTALSRVLALARVEFTLLLRNKVACFYAVALNPLLILMLATSGFGEEVTSHFAGSSLGVLLLAALAVLGSVVAVYYNLTSASVARREELVLKRLRTGEARSGEILAALAAPNIVILVVQFALTAAVIHVWLVPLNFTNVIVTAIGILLGAIVLAEMAYLTGAFTRTVESAQLSTSPGLMVGMLISGVIVPAAILPPVLVTVLEYLPIYPMSQLVFIGMSGRTIDGLDVTFVSSWSAAAPALAVLAAWTILGAVAVRHFMKWEPRR